MYENLRENLHDLGVGNGIWGIIPKEFNKRKNRWIRFIKTKNFCTSQDTIKEVKWEFHRMGKSTCKYLMSDKGLVSIHKAFTIQQLKKPN